MKGTVTFFDEELGEGEIETAEGPVFFKASQLAKGLKSVSEGAEVGFKRVMKPQGPIAANILVLSEPEDTEDSDIY